MVVRSSSYLPADVGEGCGERLEAGSSRRCFGAEEIVAGGELGLGERRSQAASHAIARHRAADALRDRESDAQLGAREIPRDD